MNPFAEVGGRVTDARLGVGVQLCVDNDAELLVIDLRKVKVTHIPVSSGAKERETRSRGGAHLA